MTQDDRVEAFPSLFGDQRPRHDLDGAVDVLGRNRADINRDHALGVRNLIVQGTLALGPESGHELHAVAVIPWVWRPDRGDHRWIVNARQTTQLVAQHLGLVAQLCFVVGVLPVAPAAQSEVGARRFGPVGRCGGDGKRQSPQVRGLAFGDESVDFLIRQGAGDEGDLPINASDRLTAVTYPMKREVDFVWILKRAAPNRWGSWFAIVFGVIPKVPGILILVSSATGAVHRIPTPSPVIGRRFASPITTPSRQIGRRFAIHRVAA